MNFNEFTDEVVALLKEKMGSTCTVTVTEVLKNNRSEERRVGKECRY